MQRKTRTLTKPGWRQIMMLMMIIAALFASGISTALAAPKAQTGSVAVTVQDANGPYGANQIVYAFDGSTYFGASAITDASGIATFTLPDGSYRFATDVHGERYFSDTGNHCTVPTCTAVALTVPVFGTVDVTVENANGPIANQVVYAFDGAGSTYTGFSATTGAAGEPATFTLPTGAYTFASDDVNGARTFTTTACDVPTCTAATLTMPVIGAVDVTVADANGPIANQVVYAFDGTGSTYTGLSATTGAAGEPATFTLPAGQYQFASDDVNGTRTFSDTACDVPTCTAVTISMSVIGTVAVTVEDANGPLANQTVYAFDETGTTYTGFAAATGAAGEPAVFTLPTGAYTFASDDVNGTRTFTTTICDVPTCTTATLTMPVVEAVAVTVVDAANNLLTNQIVYAFDGTTYTGLSSETDAAGVAVFNLPAGSYRFATDVNGERYYSDAANHCTVPGCATATLTVQTTTLPAAVCAETGAGSRTCDLWATTGSITLPDGNAVTIWGYADSAAGAAQLPGPLLVVNEGDTVTVNLTNLLDEDTALYFPGFNMIPDLTGAAANGGTATYTFVADAPGTYRYEAGLLPNAQHQVAMGLVGVVIVRPSTAGQAYNSSTTAFDDEALVVLSEIDPALNNSTDPATFDMRDYAPKYWLINGLAYPHTEPIATAPGNRVLLRYVNVGLEHHTMSLIGLEQALLAEDANLYIYARKVVAETIAPGQTKDVLVTIPADTPGGAQLALHNSDMLLHNNNAPGFGGMLTFLTTPAGAPGSDEVGPATTAVSLSESPTDGTVDVTLTAIASDATTGNANIQAAEYYIDDTNGTPTAMTAGDGAFDTSTENIEGVLTAATIAALSPGDHTVYVRSQDALGNWGSFNFVTLRLEINDSGPATYGLTLMPNPSAGDVGVMLSGTADDSATGNGHIQAAEYFIDSVGADGSGTAMMINVDEPIASIDDTLSAATLGGLSEGVHTLSVHSQDSFGFWGPMATIDLEIDLSGPDTTNVIIEPNPNNGQLPINPSQYAARLDATISDPVSGQVQSNLYSAEFFIGAPGADGTGIPMYARDGLFNSPSEAAYAWISLVNINSLGEGSHTIYVHGRDASGNWGSFGTTVLVIDKGGPTVSGANAAPNPTAGATAVTLTAVAASGSPVDVAEWFVDADPGTGNGTPMTVTPNGGSYDLSATIDVSGWADGNYTLYVRARDTAGTWSGPDSVVLNVSTAAAVYGVSVSPAADAQSGAPGATVSYILDVTNTGNGTDTFDVTLAGNGWTTTVPTTVGPLADGATTQLTVDVTIPAGAADGDMDTVDVTVASQGDPGQTAVASLTTTASVTTVTDLLYFSTAGNYQVAGTGGAPDDADLYSWDGATFTRIFDASVAGLPGNADVDGLHVVDMDTFYVSFNDNNGVNVPGIGVVEDEDIVLYDAGVWSLYFDGGEVGLSDNNGEDVDAFTILADGSVLISGAGGVSVEPNTLGARSDEDVIQCTPTLTGPITACTWTVVFDGGDVGLSNNGGEDVNGIDWQAGTLYLTTVNDFSVAGLSGNGFDIFSCDGPTTGEATACAGFTLFFDGSVAGMINQIDAFDLP